MKAPLRNTLAGLAGLLAAFASIALLEMASHALFSMPPPPATPEPEAMQAYVASLPTGALLSVAFAWFVAVLLGAWVARRLAHGGAQRYPLLVGGVVLLVAALNFTLIPHPAWFVAVGLAAIAAATLLAYTLARPRPAAAP